MYTYQEKQMHLATQIFYKNVLAALFIMAPKWKQPKCVPVCPSQLENGSTGEWI